MRIQIGKRVYDTDDPNSPRVPRQVKELLSANVADDTGWEPPPTSVTLTWGDGMYQVPYTRIDD